MTEEEGFIIEAALHAGCDGDEGMEVYTFTEKQLLIFARMMQKKHMVQEWQPIETAPRDGTEFFAYSKSRIYITRPRIDCYGNSRNTFLAVPKKPTHWMPLPPPPALKGII